MRLKKTAIMLILAWLLLPLSQAEAADIISVNLDNYYYAHTDQTGRTTFRDKYGSTVIYGDTNEHNAQIYQVSISSQGLGSGDKIYVITPDGTERLYTGGIMYLGDDVEHFSIVLDKTSSAETYAKMTQTYVHDDSNGGAYLYYNYTGSTPTQYGSLPAASPSPTTTTATPTPTPSPSPSPTPTPIYDVAPYQAGDLLVWSNPLVNTAYVAIYKDGELLTSITDNPRETSTYPLQGNGVYTVKVVSSQGNLIGTGSVTITDGSSGSATPTPTPTPSDGSDPAECTAGCQNLREVLDCPEWDTYMGEWANMLSSVIPPPPNWDVVADKIGAATVNHLAQWAGSVPDAPTREEISYETIAAQPQIDTSVETDGLTPQVPADYSSGAITFDLESDAPTIQVTDESSSFVITDPLSNLEYDAPGVKVIPGDPRNNTGGIKIPDQVDTGDPAPTPTPAPSSPGGIVFDLPRPSMPRVSSAPAPTPGGSITFDLPRPSMPASSSAPAPTPGSISFDLPRPSYQAATAPVPTTGGQITFDLPRPNATAGNGPIPSNPP